VKILNQQLIIDFTKKHPQAKPVLSKWSQVVLDSKWASSNDVNSTFSTASLVKGIWIFNLGGNKFRLAASIKFQMDTLTVISVMTHNEYNKDKWK